MPRPIGLYLHVPFCAGKCPYCDFYSLCAQEGQMDAYAAAMQRSLSAWAAGTRRQADSLYFGGGTPSLLGEKRLARLIRTARHEFGLEHAEITVECNPSSATRTLMQALAREGVNRISLGLQSADDTERRALGRQSDAAQVKAAVRMAHQAGVSNISLDLMIGIPGQTAESLRRSVQFCVGCGVRHISAYLLKIEDGTPFSRQRDSLVLPDEDTVCDLYEEACALLTQEGFQQYEISNFAHPGFESRHNLKYWRCEEYLGLGPAAHSFLDGKRFYHPRDLERFLRGEAPIDDGPGGGFEEYVMLRLRLAEGLRLGQLQALFGEPAAQQLARRAQPLAAHGLLCSDASGIRLTRRGFLLSNSVITALLWQEDVSV